MRNLSVTLIVLLVVFQSCDRKESERGQQISKADIEEFLIKKNKDIAQLEAKQIDAFAKKNNWKMNNTGTGLRYLIYQDSTGIDSVVSGNTVKINYSITLLNGDTCYSNKITSFIVEQSEIESGLHEGIKYLTVGDRAKMILPSHLAHGLVGDMQKIPRRSSIVCDVELISFN